MLKASKREANFIILLNVVEHYDHIVYFKQLIGFSCKNENIFRYKVLIINNIILNIIKYHFYENKAFLA